MDRIKLALLPDFVEEGWPSMELVATQLNQGLKSHWKETFDSELLRPPFQSHFTFLPSIVDRIINRFVTYPQFIRPRVNQFNLFHICDHSYAHLAHELPIGKFGVYCHDIDTFRSGKHLLKPLTGKILSGLKKAEVVFYSTESVRKEILDRKLVQESKLIHAPYGVSEEFTPSIHENESQSDEKFLLHVSSCIPRKRIDVLLKIFIEISKTYPQLNLIQVGGEWSTEHKDIIHSAGVESRIQQLKGLSRKELASLYRKCELVLLPSESEGFGIPVIESLACGAKVIASDIPVLREVGKDAVTYCPVGDISKWVAAIKSTLQDSNYGPNLSLRLDRASHYSWKNHAAIIAKTYKNISLRDFR